MLGTFGSLSKWALVVFCCLAPGVSARGGEILTNGGFETPDLTTTGWVEVPNGMIAEWGTVDLGEDPHLWAGKLDLYLPAAEGDQYCSGNAAVTFNTVVDTVYVVRWKAYAYSDHGNAGNILTTGTSITITGGTLNESQHPPNNTQYDYSGIHTRWIAGGVDQGGVWQEFMTLFTATAASVTLAFEGTADDAPFIVAIDAVSIQAADGYNPEDVPWEPPPYPHDPKTYEGPLDLILGGVDVDQDGQAEGNEDQEDEGGGIEEPLGVAVPLYAMVSHVLEDGTATLRISVPEWVRVFDADGIEVDGSRSWTTDDSDVDDGNSRRFTVYSHGPVCGSWFHLSVVDQDPPATLDREEDAVTAYGDCACDYSTGSSQGTNSSVDFKIDLGTLRYGDSAGYLHLKASEPSADLYTPGALQIFTHNDLFVNNLDQNGGTIQAPLYASDLWGVAKVTVASSTEYRIAFYEDENTLRADTANDAQNAYRVVTVKKPAGATGNSEIYISETQRHSGVTTRYWHYEYASGGGTDTWLLTEGATVGGNDTAIRVTRRQETTSGSERTETLGIYEPADTTFLTPIYEVEEVYTEFDWGEEMTSRIVDPNGLKLTETWTYDDGVGSGTNYARLVAYQSATGYWERYRYAADSNGMEYRDLTVAQLHDNPLNMGQAIATAAANNIATYVSHQNLLIDIQDDMDTGNDETVYVEKTTVFVTTVLETTAYKIVRESVTNQTDHDEKWSVASTVADPEDATEASSLADLIGKILRGEDSEYFIINRSWFWKHDYTLIDDASDPGEIYKSISADGVLTLYNRSYSFRRRTTVTESGYDYDSDEDIDYGARTTVVQDPRGNVESTLIERTVSENGWFVESFVGRLQEDIFGRPTETGYYFGADALTASTGGTVNPAYHTFDVHACCGTGSFTSHVDRGGVQTRVDMDALGRQVKVTTGVGSTSMELVTEYGLDAAGNVLTMTRKPLASSAEPDLVTTSTYNPAGMLTSASDPEGRTVHLTYGRVKSGGGAYTPGVDTGHFWWEVRQYGEDNSVPVRVAWADSQGDNVLSFTATTSWDGVSAPTATEALTAEHTRSMTEYLWVTVGSDREYRATSRVYHDLYDYGQSEPLEMGLDDEGVDGTNYLVTSEVIADPLGRIAQATDAAGNITAPVYEDGTGMLVGTRMGIDAGSLKTVATMRYNEFTAGTEQTPTGARRPYMTRAYGVRPGLNAAPTPDAGMTSFVYVEADVDFTLDGGSDYLVSRTVWTRPEHGPWASDTYNAQGQRVASRTYENGDTGTVLTAVDFTYITGYTTANNGRMQTIDRYPVVGGTVQANSLRTSLFYNDAGLQLKTESPGRGLTKIELDDYGRIAREVFASAEGTNTDIEGANAFTDDVVLTETVYTYNEAGQVVQSTSYDRAHDAAPGSVTGLLSDAAANRSRISHSASWYDDNGRLTHTATYGTNGGAAFTRPGTAPAPGDNWIVTEVAYNAAGYAHLTTDNKGIQTRRYYNNAGQVTYVVENYVSKWFTDSDDPTTVTARSVDACRITAYAYEFASTNAAGLRISMTAFDPAADGNGAGNQDDNQTTHFIYTGELASGKRGYVPTNSRLAAVLHADAVGDGETRASVVTDINNNTAGDFVYTEVYAGGEVYRVSDQRDARWVSTYTDEGYLASRSIDAAGAWTAPSDSDLRYEYTYGDAGELLTVTAFDVASGGAANRTSAVSYTYDGFYNRLTDSQDHDPTANSGAGVPLDVTFGYDTTNAGGIYTNAYRRASVTYPNGRVIKLYYTPGSIDHAISRPSGIDEVVGGSDDVITRYDYLGSGRLARKSYAPTGWGGEGPRGLRLDFIDEGTEGDLANDGYDASWDRFGRATRVQWEHYDENGDGADVAGSDGENVFLTRHGYDRVGNALYDQREVYAGYSNTRRFDDLHRMVGQDQGPIVLDGSGDVDLDANGHASVDAFWQTRGRDWDLDQVNNATAVDTESAPNSEVTELNTGNEITALGSNPTDPIEENRVDFSSTSNLDIFTEGINCDLGQTSDVQVTGGYLELKSGTTTAPAIILTGEARGTLPIGVRQMNTDGTGLAGIVFGYKSATDYWVLAINPSNGDWEVYHMHDADSSGTIDYTDPDEKELIGSHDRNDTSTSTWYYLLSLPLSNTAYVARSGLDLSDVGGYPSGRYGLYAECDARWDYFRAVSERRTASLGPAWETTDSNQVHDAGSGNGRLETNGTWHRQHLPILLRGLRAQRFQVTFTMERSSSDPSLGKFIFNYRDRNNYDFIILYHYPTGQAPQGCSVRNGESYINLAEDRDSDEVPDRTAGQVLWYRVVSDGVDVKVFAGEDEAELDDNQTNDRWCMSTVAAEKFAFEDGVGRFGFSGGSYTQYWDNIRFETDPDNNASLTNESSYEKLEYADTFDLTGWKLEKPAVYDAAGNLTFNGYQQLTYDGHNRLIKVENAWWDDANDEVQLGSVVAEMQYDALGRLIVDRRYDAEGLAEVVHRYYVGHSEVETRNGSDYVLSQQVWDALTGRHYIDSLAQVAHNLQPGHDDDTGTAGTQDLVDTRLYALQDRMFNVLGLATLAGQVVERYEYDAYGRRLVYQAGGMPYAEFAWLDISGDGLIGGEELDVLYANIDTAAAPYDRSRGNFNGDSIVDSTDLSLIVANWQSTAVQGNDTLVMATAGDESQRLNHGASTGQALNDIGFQGLRHDPRVGGVYNRARWYAPDHGRFYNADPHPVIFPDGMSRYAAYHVLYGGLDPLGLDVTYEQLEAITADGEVTVEEVRTLDFSREQSAAVINALSSSRYQKTATEVYNIWFGRNPQRNETQRENLRSEYPGLTDREICFERADRWNRMKARMLILRAYDKKLDVYVRVVGPTAELILMVGEAPLIIAAPLRPRVGLGVAAQGNRLGQQVTRNIDDLADGGGVAWNNGWRTADGKFASPLGIGRSGGAAEASVWNAVEAKSGWSVIRGRFHVRDSCGQLRVYDGVAVSPSGRYIGLEIKSGSAARTPAQRIFDEALNASGRETVQGVGGQAGEEVRRSILIRPGT